jgi:DNA-binding transcriptional LysR family regulator
VNLTAEGHALVDHARRLLEDAASVVARFRGRDPLRGQLRIGVNESFALLCMHELLQRLEVEYPNLRTSIRVGDTGDVSRLLNERKLDVGIVSQPDIEPHVQGLAVGINRLGWFAGPQITLPRKALTPEVLARFHLTISPPSARLHGTAMTWFAQAGVTPLRVSTCNSLPVTISMILRGLAIGLVPTILMQEHVRRREARFVRVSPAMGGHRVMLCNQASEFGPKLKQILDLVRTILSERGLFA